MRRDLGDFPTPPALVAAVLEHLGPIGPRWARVLEPTCGAGRFVSGLIAGAGGVPPREILGIELQAAHYQAARRVARGAPAGLRVEVAQADLFGLDLKRDLAWRGGGGLLVVGNPPWVTNAALGTLESDNLPKKSNVKNLRGIDARTGASNFDIAEAVWLKLIRELADQEPTIALLCKTAVARKVLEFAATSDLPLARAAVYRIDARKWFGAAVDACLFRVTVGPPGLAAPGAEVPVFGSLEARTPECVWGFARGRLVADLPRYRALSYADGQCPLTWRQGLKHDAAAVMELEADPVAGSLRNKLGEPVDVEPGWTYPLLKGADLLRPTPADTRRRSVIVTQRRLGDDTTRLQRQAPRLWAYLHAHASAFAKRRSSIYRGQPPFSMFGLGPYSFAPYKVAVSGLGKVPRFHAIGPVDGRPVMLDDTCYFLACRTPEQAALAAALLNAPETLGLIGSLVFRDAKRPVTKALLTRLDLGALAARVDRDALIARAENELERLVSMPDALLTSSSNAHVS